MNKLKNTKKQHNIHIGHKFYDKLNQCCAQLDKTKKHFEKIEQENVFVKMCQILINDPILNDFETFKSLTSKVSWKYVDWIQIDIKKDGTIFSKEIPKCKY